jgi:hypothetical protein
MGHSAEGVHHRLLLHSRGFLLSSYYLAAGLWFFYWF